MFAPTVFSRRDPRDGAHIVHKQPESDIEIDQARAALAACPVAAIRVETKADRHHRGLDPPTPKDEILAPKLALNPKFNGLDMPFPRPIVYGTDNSNNKNDGQDEDMVYHVGHHNENSFGGCPYLFSINSNGSNGNDDEKIWIMVDTPKYSKLAVRTIESLTGAGRGPDYLFLTHVDDTADHNKWKEHYPNMKRIFHSGDLGRHNWLGDSTLNDVEILLNGKSEDDPAVPLQLFTLDGSTVASLDDVPDEKVLIVHTPGHSPGSISLWKRPTASDSPTYSKGVLFTGDTYSFTTRGGGHMSGFPRYGNNRQQQSRVLPRLLDLEWQIVAPGHGHVRDYTTSEGSRREEEMQPAIHELETY